MKLSKEKKYRFFYHYYRQKKKMSVHFRNRCYIVDDIRCFYNTFTKYNKTQPYLVMQGWAEKVIVTVGEDDKVSAIIT